MAEQQLSEEQLADYRAAFSLFDKDGDGHITSEELGIILQNLGQSPSPQTLKNMIKQVDLDGNGQIQFSQFIILMTKKSKRNEDLQLNQQAYKIFGKDQNGLINSKELRLAMKKINITFSEEETESLIRDADIDGDGCITYKQFAALLKNIK